MNWILLKVFSIFKILVQNIAQQNYRTMNELMLRLRPAQAAQKLIRITKAGNKKL
jgi:hypothetical protein